MAELIGVGVSSRTAFYYGPSRRAEEEKLNLTARIEKMEKHLDVIEYALLCLYHKTPQADLAMKNVLEEYKKKADDRSPASSLF